MEPLLSLHRVLPVAEIRGEGAHYRGAVIKAQQGLFHLGAVPASKKIAVNSTAGDPPLGYPELKLQLSAALYTGFLFHAVLRRLAVVPLPGIVAGGLDFLNPVQILLGKPVGRRRLSAEHFVRQQVPKSSRAAAWGR